MVIENNKTQIRSATYFAIWDNRLNDIEHVQEKLWHKIVCCLDGGDDVWFYMCNITSHQGAYSLNEGKELPREKPVDCDRNP